MSSPLLALIIIIVFLAFIFAKSKGKAPRKKDQYNSEGRRKGFKDFERERTKRNQGESDRVYELGGYGITRASTRSESHFTPSGKFNDQRINNDPRGIFGESAMAALTARVCDSDKRKYVLMRNLYIPSRGGTTEIDALLLHQSGIYVLESKNLSGEISGTLEMERWEQHLNERTEHTFHNPIRQNIGHILALQHHLKIRREQAHFISVIVFSDRCVLKKVPANNDLWNIVHCSELQNALQGLISSRKTIYSKDQLEDFYWQLSPCMDASESIKAEHRKYIQSNHRG